MPKAQNFTGDINQLWLLTSNRMRVYRDIVSEAEKGNVALATLTTVQNAEQTLVELLEQTGEAIDEAIGSIEAVLQESHLVTGHLDPTLAGQFGLVWDEEAEDYYSETDIDPITELRGRHYETILTKIRADAESITESFTMQQVTTLEGNINDLTAAVVNTTNLVNGQIRRGFIDWYNPQTQTTERVFGIVIASRNVFSSSGASVTPSGEVNPYYEISSDSGMCFGLYTATGWQFWNDGKKLGWFDTNDGQLHVNNIRIETNLVMGSWRLSNRKINSTEDAFGIKFTGA